MNRAHSLGYQAKETLSVAEPYMLVARMCGLRGLSLRVPGIGSGLYYLSLHGLNMQ